MDIEFNDQYNHPLWQKKRLEIMKRDKFNCVMCDRQELPLHVHHRYYKRGVMLWEYDNKCYVTVHEDCHQYLHEIQDKLNTSLSMIDPNHLECFSMSDLRKLARMLFNGELEAVKKYIKNLKHR